MRFVHEQIHATVRSPEVATLLMPRDHAIGAKRICVDTSYYETYNRDNVTLVDLRSEPLQRATPYGVVVGEREIEMDDLVLATGFDAMTGVLNSIDLRGRDGRRLSEVWAHGPVNYLGMAVHGFPNMFIVNGPGSPSVFANMVLTSEQQVDWLIDLFGEAGGRAIEATVDAETGWVEKVGQLGSALLAGETNSWYLGSNVPGKPRVFMPFAGGFHTYKALCDAVAENDYEGFDLG